MSTITSQTITREHAEAYADALDVIEERHKECMEAYELARASGDHDLADELIASRTHASQPWEEASEVAGLYWGAIEIDVWGTSHVIGGRWAIELNEVDGLWWVQDIADVDVVPGAEGLPGYCSERVIYYVADGSEIEVER